MHPRPSYFSTYSLAWSVAGSRHLSLGSDGTGRTARFSRPPAEYLVAFLPTSCRSAVNRSVAPLRFSNFDFMELLSAVRPREGPALLRPRFVLRAWRRRLETLARAGRAHAETQREECCYPARRR